ncbi:hypothetical protein PIB30_079060 [Stylosanthes scabra]|uniref:Uncharacterized protein n=1 Tax=Stylosanthes scabra TaxID=79078 RepID=A0ABU6WUE9_9FABA|nr:hypothetical protein [Stylosanthes scabra]
MECFITWQLEPKNSGLFDQKPILNSCLNETNELKSLRSKKTEFWSIEAKSATPRRGTRRLGVTSYIQSQRLGHPHQSLGVAWASFRKSTPRRQTQLLGVA